MTSDLLAMNTKRILIIEDDQDLLQLYSIALRKEGYTVLEASNGYEGLEKVQEGCDLILLDMMMPMANGSDVLSMLQVHETAQKIPVIIVSNLSPDDTDLSQLDEHLLDYWVKAEITPSILVQRLHDYFS